MPASPILERYVRLLVSGHRVECRELIRQQLEKVEDATEIYHTLLWPAMEQVEKLYRSDRINSAAERMATLINRAVADQLQVHLGRRPENGKRMLIACAEGEPEELGSQMCADLFEASGWEVYLLGGGVPNDEILNLVGQLRPDILLVFGTQPTGVPGVRRLIDLIRDIGSNPTMNIMVSGGVFNRAEGLWKEVNADLMARTALEALPLAEQAEARDPTIKVAGPAKKRRRRRRPSLLAQTEG